MSPDPGSPLAGRSIEQEIVINAPAEAVWRALTDATELMRWFPLEAKVEPGAGGAMWLSWDGSTGATARIEVWEPNRRLRTVEPRRDSSGRPVELAVEFFIESRGGRTVLRVVHSGFGAGADWDQEYDGTSRGWSYELRGLKHYLDRHRGETRRVAWVAARTSLSPEACYAGIVRRGLAAEGDLTGLDEGDPYRIAGRAGAFEGVVLVNRPPLDFAGTVTNLNDALLRYEFYGGSPKLWVATWGVDQAVVKALGARLREILVRAVPPATLEPA